MNESSPNDSAVVVSGAVKCYGKLRAVDGVSLRIARGECYALLGPNGAGKTTLSRMIAAQFRPDGGSLRVLGLDPWLEQAAAKSRLGVVQQDDCLDDDLDIIGNLRIYGRFFWLQGPAFEKRVSELLAFMGLEGREHAPVQSLSGGMRRRLTIARALLNRPELLLLDEPTTGLDPQVRHSIWSALRQLKSHGLTILLTTHYMEEAAQLAGRVGIMDRGRLIAEDSPERLVNAHMPRWALDFDEPGHRQAAIAARDIAEKTAKARSGGVPFKVEQVGERVFAYSEDEKLLQHFAAEHGMAGRVRLSSLEDVFLKLAGRSLDG